MALMMYDLCGSDSTRRFSPYCWLVKLVVAHKQLPLETTALPFTDKDTIAFADWKQLPVLTDGDTTVVDSWKIVNYLETQYPQNPVVGSSDAMGQAMLVKLGIEMNVMGPLLRSVILDIHNHLAPVDAAYFRETREARFGASLEELQGGREAHRVALNTALGPYRATLKRQDWLSGDAIGLADLLLFASFMWARSVSDFQLLDSDDPVYAWRDALFEHFADTTSQSPGYDFADADLSA